MLLTDDPVNSMVQGASYNEHHSWWTAGVSCASDNSVQHDKNEGQLLLILIFTDFH